MFQWKVKYSRIHDRHKLNFVGVESGYNLVVR